MNRNLTHTRQVVLSATVALISYAFSGPLAAGPIRVLAWDDQVASMRIALVDAAGSKEVQGMHPSKRTKIYQISAGGDAAAVEVIGKITPDGKPCREKLVIPDTVKRPLLVVLPDEKAVSGIRLHVIEDDESGFPWGSTRFVNATGRKLVFVAEKKALELPNSWNPVQLTPVGEERNIEVRLFFRDEPQKPFYSSVWQYRKGIRTLVFLVPGTDPRLGPVAMKVIPENHLIEKQVPDASVP